MAEVKAPRSWPKSSLSISSEGMAAQLTSTKGPEAPSALGVEPAGDQLLAGPVLTGDEGTGIEGCDPFDDLPHVADGVR